MKRSWNWNRDLPATGVRYADALGCTSSYEYAYAALQIHGATDAGVPVRITASRIKIDAEGNEIPPTKDSVGDFITSAYDFEVLSDEGEPQTFQVPRRPEAEGEQEARDQTVALGIRADRGFCESMLQIKVALDRFGGTAFIQPYLDVEAGIVIGYAVQYEHLPKNEPAPAPVELAPDGDPAEEAEPLVAEAA